MMPSSSTIHPHHHPFNNNMVPYSNNNPMPMPTTATMVYYGTPHHPQHHPHHPHHPQAGPQPGPQQAPPQAYHLFRNHQHPPQGPYYYSPTTTVVVPGPTGVMPLPNVMYIQPTTHPAYAASHNGNGNGNGNGAFHYGPIPNGNYGSAMMMILPTNNNSAPTTTTPPIKAGASHPTNRAPATTASTPSPIKSRPSRQQPKRGAPVASLLMSPRLTEASSSTNQAEAPSPIKSGPSLKSKSRSKSKEEAPTTPPRSRSTSPENVASHYRTPTKHVVRTGDANRGNGDDDGDDGHGCGQSQPSKSNKRPRLAPRPRLVSPNQTTSSSKTAAPNKNRTVPNDGGTTTTVPSIPEVGISGGTSEEKVASTSKLAPIPNPANDNNHQPSVPPIEPSPEVYHCMKNVKWKIRKVLPPAPQLRLQSAAFLAALSRCDYCWSIQGKRTSCTCVRTSLRDRPRMIAYLIRLKVVVERMRVRSPAMFDHYVKLLMKEHAGDVLRGFFPFPRLPKEDDGDDDDDDDYDYDGSSSSSSSSKKDDLERLLPDFANRRICKGLWRKIVGVPKSKFEEFERMVFYSNARSSRALSSRSSSLAVASEEGGGGGTLNGEDIRYLLNCVGLPTSNNDEEEDGADDDDNVDNGGSAASFKGLFGDDGSSVSTRSACTGVGSHISTLSQFSFARYM